MPYKDPDKQRAWQRTYQRRRKAVAGRSVNKTATNKRWELNNPEKVRAQRLVATRVKRKKWPKASFFKCTDCDLQAVHYHHEDYSLWWSVEPLCISCHYKRHRLE